jgi:hypothetical protein
LNATGQPEVQQLLTAISLSGHGVPPLMDTKSRMEGSWNAGAASGILHSGSDGGGSVGRVSTSSIGGRSPSPLGGRSPSTSSIGKRSPSQQDPQGGSTTSASTGLLSSIRRIGSRSPSPFSKRQQESPAM